MKSRAVRSLALWVVCGNLWALRTASAWLPRIVPLPIRSRLLHASARIARRYDDDTKGAASPGCGARESEMHHTSPTLTASTDRRKAIVAFGSLAPALAAVCSLAIPDVASASTESGTDIRGTQVTPFNSLMFQYRGSDFAGLRADDLDEPSISYTEFMANLQSGKVSFVEFMAPDGDAAYATIQGQEKPIRIGEGYPVEQHDGYSSPAFAIRAVQNAGVPYKFVVPGLAKYSSMSTTTTTANRK